MKKEIKDEITHVLYDQTRRTPIVIPVINEIGGAGPQGNGGSANARPNQPRQNQGQQPYRRPEPVKIQPPQVPDTEVIAPKTPRENRGY